MRFNQAYPQQQLSIAESRRGEVDPWGDSAQEETPTPSSASLARHSVELIDSDKLIAASLALPPHSEGTQSLRSSCLGCLAQYLEELLEAGPPAAAMLTPDDKLALLAVARRRGLLGDKTLMLLADSDFLRLDVSHSSVTAEGLTRVLPLLPQLRHLSLLRMELLDPTLRLIADHCLQLETLRLGNFASQRQKAVCKALLALLPSFDSSVVADDWERCTVPLAVHLEELRRQCPKLVINPPRQRFSQALGPRRLPPEADLLTPLDCRDALQVAQYAWAELCPALDGSEDTFGAPASQTKLSVAERFKMAYKQQAERQAARAERNRKQAWRRYIRKNPTQVLIHMAESGVPLKGTRR